MKWLPDKEDRDPRWIVTQILFFVVIMLLLSPVYVDKMDLDWRVPCLMFAMWGGFALATLRKPQFMKDREARWIAEFEAKVQAAGDRKETRRLINQQGDGI